MRTAGIAVVTNAEYLEPTPLRRAEWIKVMAALTDDGVRASAVFDQVVAAYTDIAKAATGAAGRRVARSGRVERAHRRQLRRAGVV